MDRTLPWVFRLSATIQLPGGETDRTEVREYVFTKRLSGTLQVGGSKQNDAIFEIPQELLDALYEMIDDMELPPEAKELPVAEPSSIEPLPAAQPIPSAEL